MSGADVALSLGSCLSRIPGVYNGVHFLFSFSFTIVWEKHTQK